MPVETGIRVQDLTYTYPAWAADQPPSVVLRDLTFEVAAGKCMAILGAAGSGKSTLCMAVAGLAPRLTAGHVEGKIWVSGRNVQAETVGELADVLGVALDDPAGQLFNPSIADEVAWGLENQGVPPKDMPDRINRALAMVGLEGVSLEQSPQTLSGGQQKRLALAAALALEPRVLILDQPSGGLSPAGKAELIGTLKGLREQHGLTILMAEVDPEFVAELADTALILDQGRAVCQGDLREVFGFAAEHPETGINLPPVFEFSRLIDVSGDPALRLGDLPRIKAKKAAKSVTPDDIRRDKTSDAAITLEHLSFGYQPDKPVLVDLNAVIGRGEFVVIAGENGAGKSTLARHLIGLLRPTSGRVLINGVDAAGQTVGALARQVGLAFQNTENQIFNPTVREEIGFGPRNLGLAGDTLAHRIDETLGAFGLESVANLPPSTFSLSQRRLVALAGIAAMGTPTLVLDEPTVGLDSLTRERVLDWLVKRHKCGSTIVLITHDMEISARYAQRLIVMSDGRIIADGPPRVVFEDSEPIKEAGLDLPFTLKLANEMKQPELTADFTAQEAARVWRGLAK